MGLNDKAEKECIASNGVFPRVRRRGKMRCSLNKGINPFIFKTLIGMLIFSVAIFFILLNYNCSVINAKNSLSNKKKMSSLVKEEYMSYM